MSRIKKNLSRIITDHANICKGCNLFFSEKYKRGHASVLELSCRKCGCGIPNWPSSPYLPNQKFLVNYRIAHGYVSSGILPSQYQRLVETADIGLIPESFLGQHFLPDYNLSVDCEYTESCTDALAKEIAGSMLPDGDHDDNYQGIKIITDARHGWRKNSRQTDVVCIGYGTHLMLRDEIITKNDDQFSQRHERLGTERIYQYLKDHSLGPVLVPAHAHDRNLSVNKYIRENEDATNQNDTWHAGKTSGKNVIKCRKRPTVQARINLAQPTIRQSRIYPDTYSLFHKKLWR